MSEELKPYETALKAFQIGVKNAILSGEIPVTWENPQTDGYLGTGRFVVGKAECSMSVAERFVCYHNDLTKGMFDDEDDFEALKAMVKKHVLPEKDKARIGELQAEIDRIRGIKSRHEQYQKDSPEDEYEQLCKAYVQQYWPDESQ